VLAAGAFAHVFAIGSVAYRTSLFCALLMLGCVGLVYATIVTIARDRWTAICTGSLLAFGWYFWIYGDRAEIHAMAAFCGTFVLYSALRAYYDEDVRWYLGACAAFGVGLATHPVAIFVLPSLVLLALARRSLFGLRRSAIAIVLVLAPLTLYAYLPLRSQAIVAHGMDPGPALDKPLGAAIVNTDNPQTRAGFIRLVTGAEFHAGKSVAGIVDVPAYAGKFHIFGEAIYREFTPIGCAAACICLVLLIRRRAVVAIALLLAALLPAAFALEYPPVVEIERYFFIPMIAIAAIVGLGIATLAPSYRNLLRIPLAAAALVLLVINYPDAHLRAVFGAEDLIAEASRVTPRNAIVIADWTRGTALAYAQYVDGGLPGRTLDIAWPFQDMRYLRRWLHERPVYYVGRPIVHSHRLLLCRASQGYPIYSVQLKPAHC
jgi:4-amino-4-deoxy-L-arabinose transferase-like glycosyltransferase